MQINTNEILNYWFSNTLHWFDKSLDKYITSKYKLLVDNIQSLEIKTERDIIALLVIGDQFTRNIYRDTDERTKNDKYILPFALNLIKDDLKFELNYRLCILLVLRHNKQSHLLDIVCDRLKIYFKEFNNSKLLQKFYMNTIKNYSSLTDTIKIGRKLSYADYKEEYKTILEEYKTQTNKHPNIFQNIKYKNIGISLSGGVDSMVLLNVLKPNIAIHIEYCNRSESALEREFLEFYCSKLNIKLYYRTIHYISRKDPFVSRELFEEEAKIARFNLYKYVIDKENVEGICLGHHSGDIVENVFTNLIKGRNLKDFTVMQEKQEQHNVTIFRPFLNLNKEVIINYAQSENIPYFLNSTPSWSCRGVLRDQVIPILKKQFGDFEQNIVKFTKDCSQYVQNNVYEKKIGLYSVKMNSQQFKDTWTEEILLDIMHNNGYPMVSHKTQVNFMQWLKGKKNKQFELSKHVFCYYRNNNIYFINYTKIINNPVDKQLLLEELDSYLPPKLI